MKSRREEHWLEWACLVAGVMAGWAMLWLLGGAFVLTGEMSGYGWPGYVLNGWLAHQDWFSKIDTLRTPLHPTLLGALGEAMGSYADAGRLISALSCGLAVLCAGLGAAALSGGYSGGLAALCCGLALGVHGAPSAVNQYPFLAGLSVTAVGLAAVACRLPRGLTGLLCGGALGLCLAAESRGILLVPPVAVLVLIGLVRSERWARLRLLLGFALALSGGIGLRMHHSTLQHAQMIGEARGLGRQQVLMDQQRRVIQRWVQLERGLRSACAAQETADYLTLDYLSTDCARGILTENLTVRIPRHLPLGAPLTAAGLLLLLLPVAGRRGAWLEGAAVGLLAGGGVLVLAALTPMPGRYVIQQAPLLALIGAAGAGRLAGWLPGWLPGAAMIGLTGWMVSGGWDGHSRADRPVLDAVYETYVEVYQAVSPRLAEDDRLIDCADLHLELALLPRRVRSGAMTRDVSLQACTDWIERPEQTEGMTYILLRPDQRRGSVDLSTVVADDHRWSLAVSGQGWALWSRPGVPIRR